MKKIVVRLLAIAFLFSFGCQKEELTDCEKIVQELNADLKGYYFEVQVYQDGSLVALQRNFTFNAQTTFVKVNERSFNLCTLSSYQVIENGQQEELRLFY